MNDPTNAAAAELLRKWAEGDANAGNRLLRLNLDVLHRFFINKVAEEDVPDLIQVTMLECTKAVGTFKGNSKVRTWLLGIGHNVLLHHYCERGRKGDKIDPRSDSTFDVVDTSRMSSLLPSRREQEMVVDALRRIPIDQQVILELAYWEGLTGEECGVVLGLTLPNVRGRLRRAKESLRAALKTDSGTNSEKDSVSDRLGEWITGIHQKLGEDSQGRLQRIKGWACDDAP
jgi:RNA polymerase sigma factor (sigma-70 family)